MVPCFSLASLYLPPEPALSFSTGYSVSSLEAISGFMLSRFGVTSQLVPGSSLPASLCISQEEKLSSKESHLSSWPWRQAAYSEACPLCQRMTCGTVYMERGQRCDKGEPEQTQRKGTFRRGSLVLSLEGQVRTFHGNKAGVASGGGVRWAEERRAA